jgi:uncharacterized protein YjiS (DUF1127 family)
MTLYERFQHWLVARRAERQVVEELSHYSDRELNDLGISRADVPGMAYEAGRMAWEKSVRASDSAHTRHPWAARHA